MKQIPAFHYSGTALGSAEPPPFVCLDHPRGLTATGRMQDLLLANTTPSYRNADYHLPMATVPLLLNGTATFNPHNRYPAA